MSETSTVKLTKASDSAAMNGKVQHVVLIVHEDGRLVINGSSNLVDAVVLDEALSFSLERTLRSNFSKDNQSSTGISSYPLLPVSPFSPDWNLLPIDVIRGIFISMLNSRGIVRSGRKRSLGSGDAPPGWPEDVKPWSEYKGATRSGLKKNDLTQIIIKLLEGAGLNPSNHVKNTVNPTPIFPPPAPCPIEDLFANFNDSNEDTGKLLKCILQLL